MGEKIALKVVPRTIVGKKVRQLRRQGFVPAVIYNDKAEATNVSADAVDAIKVWKIAGRHHVIEVSLDGKKRLAMIKTADIEPVKHKLRHLAMQTVKQNEKVQTAVPIKVQGEGETPAEKAGLVVLKTIESVEISALPKNLPDFVEVPGERLIVDGDHVKVADILPIEGVEIIADPTQIVATVYEPSALVAANEAATEEAQEEAEATEEEIPEEQADKDEGDNKEE